MNNARNSQLTRRSRSTVALALGASLAMALTACGSSSKDEPSAAGAEPSAAATASALAAVAVSDTRRSEILKTAFLADVKPETLDPVVLQGLEEIGGDYTEAQVATATSCLTQDVCKIGDGKQTVAMLLGGGLTPWGLMNRAAFTLQATSYPDVGTVMFQKADGNLQTMQAQLRSLVARKVKAVVSYDDFGPAMTAAFSQARAAGVPVATYVGNPGKDATKAVVTQVTSDYCADGKAMAQAAQRTVGKTGNVAFLTGVPGNPKGVAWQKCAEAWLKANAPGIDVAYKADTNWSEAGTTTATTAMIATGKKIDAVLYDYATQTITVVKAFKQAKLPVPDQVTQATDNSLLEVWEADQKSADPWNLTASSSINFAVNVAFAAVMDSVAGKQVPSLVVFPNQFVPAKVGDFVAGQPKNAPGPVVLPAPLVQAVLAG
ncbi:MAG: ABC-type sugar transport system, periplasmic component [Frankiales bacterium]|nr:ABC-type sugar transport system, periplasmic component [Frankiales bacterium]